MTTAPRRKEDVAPLQFTGSGKDASEEEGSHIAGESPAADYQPDVEQAGQDKGLGSGFLELVYRSFGSQSDHCHGQQESIDVIDDVNDGGREQVEGVEEDYAEKPEGEPGDSYFSF